MRVFSAITGYANSLTWSSNIGYLGVPPGYLEQEKENIMGLFGPKQNPKAIGERSQAHIIARLLDVGYYVFTPMETIHGLT